METPTDPQSAANAHAIAVASELNNLLQIISGTGAVMENLLGENVAAQKHFYALQTSVDRAAQLTSTLTPAQHYAPRQAQPDRVVDAPPPARPSKGAPRKPRVLLIDDEPLALELAEQVFIDEGFETKTGKSGFECIAHVRNTTSPFDLVILDLSMPFMDGEETFHRLREILPNQAVMLNTGFVAQERLERMLAAGLAGYIRKPYRPSELVAQVRSLLQKVRLTRAGCVGYRSSTSRVG